MAVIRNIDTVYVDVTQSAAEIIEWRRGNMGERMGDSMQRVSLTLADGSLYDQTGTLTAAEPDVNEQTGVVVLRMSFDNPGKLLLPGMYVQVKMPTRTAKGVFVIPQEAVSRNRRGQPVAMVVGPENVVEARQTQRRQSRPNQKPNNSVPEFPWPAFSSTARSLLGSSRSS